jgi:predicted nucleic acid-binding protein
LVLADASVLRNFAVLGWVEPLIALAGGVLYVAHGVMGLDSEEVGEIEAIRAALEDESLRHPSSPAAVAATAAIVGLDTLLSRRSNDLTVLVPTVDEFTLALRLQDPSERGWRQSLGAKARKLDAGEAVSIAIATSRSLPFASDDDDARIVYLALGGPQHLWTLDLIQEAATQDLFDEAVARSGYEELRHRYRFWGPPWL